MSCQLRTKSKETCKKKFTKNQGLFGSGKWFCSEECGDNDEDLKMVEKMHQQAEQ
jgi:hypothetical protein